MHQGKKPLTFLSDSSTLVSALKLYLAIASPISPGWAGGGGGGRPGGWVSLGASPPGQGGRHICSGTSGGQPSSCQLASAGYIMPSCASFQEGQLLTLPRQGCEITRKSGAGRALFLCFLFALMWQVFWPCSKEISPWGKSKRTWICKGRLKYTMSRETFLQKNTVSMTHTLWDVLFSKNKSIGSQNQTTCKHFACICHHR